MQGEICMENDAATRLESKIEHQSSEIKALTSSISDLALVLARKEEHDHHTDENVRRIQKQTDSNTARIAALEKISAGDETMRKVFWVILSLGVVTIAGAVFALVVSK